MGIQSEEVAHKTLVDGTEITLHSHAGGSGDKLLWVYPQDYSTGTGTSGDPWAGWQADTYNACPIGGTIYFRAGYYVLSAQWTISKAINIVGEGMGRIFIVTANATGFSIGADCVTVRDLTVDGDAQTWGQQYLACIRVGNPSDHGLFENIEVKNAGFYGMNVYEVNNSYFHNIYAHDNYEMGIHPGSDTPGLNLNNTYRDIYCYDNTHLGFGDRGNGQDELGTGGEITNNVYDNIQAWDNGEYGIQIACQQHVVISNLQAWGNGNDAGINFEYLKGVTINNCIAYDNNKAGIMIDYVDNISMVNCVSVNNNDYGLWLWTVNDLETSNCQFYDDKETPTQTSIALSGTNTNINLSGCTLTPNASEITGTTAGIVTSSEGVMDGTKAVAGDIQYHNGTNWVRLAKGTAGQALAINTGETAPEWKTISGSGSPLTVSGATAYSDSSPTSWTDLNLSSIVGVNSAFVILSFSAGSDMNALAVRQNGDTNEYYNAAVEALAYGTALGHHDSLCDMVLTCVTDTNGMIEWRTETSQTATVKVIAYIK